MEMRYVGQFVFALSVGVGVCACVSLDTGIDFEWNLMVSGAFLIELLCKFMPFRIYEVPVLNNIRHCLHPFQHRSNTLEAIDTTSNISEIPSINFCIVSTGPTNAAALTK